LPDKEEAISTAGAGTASVVAGFVLIMAAVVCFSDKGYFAKYHAELWVA
jgi:hypothetical protein